MFLVFLELMNQLFWITNCIESNIINTFCISSNSEYCYFIFCNGYEDLVPICSGINIPWTTPIVISGFLATNWAGALLQVLLLILGIFIYMPFIIKIMDKQYLEEENNMQNEEEEEDDISLDDLSFDDL